MDYGLINKYAGEETLTESPGPYSHQRPIALQLKQRLQGHEQAALKIRSLLELLEKNPSIEQFIDLSRGVI